MLIFELISLLYFYDFLKNSNLFWIAQIDVQKSAGKIRDFTEVPQDL